MIEPGLIQRAIKELETGDGTAAALAVLRLMQRTYPVAGMTADQYAAELECLTHEVLAHHAACAMVQLRITQERLAHLRAEMAQLGAFSDERPTDRAPPPESSDGGG